MLRDAPAEMQAPVLAHLRQGDADGLEALTIRRIAHDLGVTPMALYWHFKNKDELLAGVAEHVMADVTPEFDPADPWNARLRKMVEALIRVLRRHPSARGVFMQVEKSQMTSFTRATETALGLLSTAGFTLSEGFRIASYLLDGALALVDEEPGCPHYMTPQQGAEWRRQKWLALESLPVDTFPRMVEFSKTFETEPDVDEFYAFGVDLLMAGVEAMAAKKAQSSATPSSTA